MRCKRCGRKLTSPDSLERGYGKACQKKLLAAKERYKPTELFDTVECPTQQTKSLQQPPEALKEQKFQMAIPLSLNFDPRIKPGMSMLEQYRAAMKVLEAN